MQKHITKTIMIAAGATAMLMTATTLANAHGVNDKNRVEETHSIKNFDKIRVTGVYELDVQVGEGFSVFTSGKHKDVEKMKVYLKGSTLVLAQNDDGEKNINWNGRKKKNNSGIRAVITMPSLKGLDITGIGAGEVKGIKSDSLDVEVAGISDMELSGTCGRLDVDMAGLGELRAESLKCENVDVDLAGMGEISVYASKSVEADAAGMGNIEVYGNPEDVEKSKSFMASVKIK